MTAKIKGKISKSQAKRETILKEAKTSSVPKGEKIVSSSPVPAKKVIMLNFYDALREVLEGKKMTRVAWNDVEIYILMVGEFLSIHIGGKDSQLITSRGDMEGVDWYSLPETN